MFNKIKALTCSVLSVPERQLEMQNHENSCVFTKVAYSRPSFLNIRTEGELQRSANHHTRPIVLPKDLSQIPWNSGYAEVINAGKTRRNEDQASVVCGLLTRPEVLHVTASDGDCIGCEIRNGPESLPYYFFGVFDGHSGPDVAVYSANHLHEIVRGKLVDILDHLLPPLCAEPSSQHVVASNKRGAAIWIPGEDIQAEELILGALEAAFHEMDELVRLKGVKGGCTALVVLFILGRVYVANAGDSRAVLCRNGNPLPLSRDFTPETESQRIRQLAVLQPNLLGNKFTHLDFSRKPTAKDIGKRMLYRDAFMTGWAYKTATNDDITKLPLVQGRGKRSRLLATIGVTRGFGDHDLKNPFYAISVKPFLLSEPEVNVYNIAEEPIMPSDVIVLGTDGLWNASSNEEVATVVKRNLDLATLGAQDFNLTSAAFDLIMSSRGRLRFKNWKTTKGKTASVDDISVFVIPLVPYKEEYLQWKLVDADADMPLALLLAVSLTSVAAAALGTNDVVNNVTSMKQVKMAPTKCGPLTSEEASELSPGELLRDLTHPCRYDRLVRPGDDDVPLNVSTRAYVYLFKSIDSQTLHFQTHILLQYRYEDPRLAYGKVHAGIRELVGETELQERIWVPHIYLSNEHQSNIMGTQGKDVLITIYPDGTVQHTVRLKTILFCWMKLEKFPFDRQMCPVVLESWSYNASDLVLRWETDTPINAKPYLHLAEYRLIDMWTNESTTTYFKANSIRGPFDGDYSVLTLTFYISREVGFYMMDYYIPSILLVIISWVSFWLDPNAQPARVTLGTSTMLTFITLSSKTASQLPKVSYIKASEIWFLGCTAFIFGSLIEFAFANTIWRRRKAVELKKVNSKYILKSTLTPRAARKQLNQLERSSSCPSGMDKAISGSTTTLSVQSSNSQLNIPGIPGLPRNETTNYDPDSTNSITLSVPDLNSPPHTSFTTMTPQEIAQWIDRRSRIVFPLSFVVFNAIYWGLVLA